jgi:hypothetical protein
MPTVRPLESLEVPKSLFGSYRQLNWYASAKLFNDMVRRSVYDLAALYEDLLAREELATLELTRLRDKSRPLRAGKNSVATASVACSDWRILLFDVLPDNSDGSATT